MKMFICRCKECKVKLKFFEDDLKEFHDADGSKKKIIHKKCDVCGKYSTFIVDFIVKTN